MKKNDAIKLLRLARMFVKLGVLDKSFIELTLVPHINKDGYVSSFIAFQIF